MLIVGGSEWVSGISGDLFIWILLFWGLEETGKGNLFSSWMCLDGESFL